MNDGATGVSPASARPRKEQSACPSSDIIRSFAAGLLSEQSLLYIADHLESCSKCSDVLVNVADLDSLVQNLRAAAINEPPNEERRRRIQRVCERSCVPSDEISTLPKYWSQHHSADPFVGRTIGRCRLTGIIGKGGMGSVYSAMHERLGRKVAVKLISPAGLNDSRLVARFRQEVIALGGIDHPNVVRAFDAGEQDGQPFLVMEYIDGASASQLVERLGPLSIPSACELVRQAAEGLHSISAHGRVHRDVKPSNLLVDRQGTVKIVDLGLARVLQSRDGDSVTSDGEVFGTIDYMSPEQIRGAHTVDIRSDIYGLGCTLFKLLTGTAPYADRRNVAAKLHAHAHEEVPTLIHLRPDVPIELIDALHHMLAKNPGDRYGSPAEVSRAMHNLASAHALIDDVSKVRAGLNANSPAHSDETEYSSVRLKASSIRLYNSALVRLGVILAAAVIGWIVVFYPREPLSQGPHSAHIPDRLGLQAAARIWNNPPGTPSWRVSQKDSRISIEYVRHAALRLGSVDANDYQIELSITPGERGGEVGVFIGHRKVPSTSQTIGFYQLIGIQSDSNGVARANIVGHCFNPNLVPSNGRLPDSQPAYNSATTIDISVPHKLRIVVRLRRIVELSIDNTVLFRAVAGDSIDRNRFFFDAGGEFGVYAINSDGAFARLTLNEGVVSLNGL